MKSFFTFFLSILFIGEINATTFTSTGTGNWSNAATWTRSAITGTNTTPTSVDDVVILTGHTVTLDITTCVSRAVSINNGATLKANSKTLFITGNFTNLGSVSGSFLKFYLAGTGLTFSSATTFTCGGDWYVQKTCSIAAGTVINKKALIILQNVNVGVVNNGSVTLLNTSTSSTNGRLSFSKTSNFWKNTNGSSLTVSANNTLAGSVLLDCSANSNTMTYATKCTSIDNGKFYNLNITAVTTKSLTARLKVFNDLTVTGGASNTLNTNGKSISVGGNLSVTGTVNFTAIDTLIFKGTGNTQTVGGSIAISCQNLAIDNPSGTVTFANTTTVNRDLIMVNGACNSGASHLLINSTAASTARIAQITTPANVSFSGTTVIGKFYTAAAATDYPTFYHDLSTPVQNTTVNDWDSELYISGIGAYDGIGGPAGVDGSVYNGTPSMHIYSEPTATWVPVSGSGTALVPGVGYDLLLLDDMDGNLNGTWAAKVINTKGIPNFGDVTVPVTNQFDGWNLIGNPYASAITLSGLVSNSGAFFPDPSFPDVYFTENGNYVPYPFSTTIIQPHQGFWLTLDPSFTPPSADVTFSEACKVIDYSSTYHRNAATYDIKLTLASGSANFYHESTINFNNAASVNYDKTLDAKYRKFSIAVAPALYMLDQKSDVKMVRNVLNDEAEEVAIPLGIFTPKAGVYYVDASIVNMNSYNYVWVENKKTGIKFDLNKPVAVEGQEMGTNTDYVLHLSKVKQNSVVSKTILENDLTVFSTENAINLKSNNADHNISDVLVYDMNGRLVLSQSNINLVAGGISKIDVTNLVTGIYIVKVIDTAGNTKTTKLIK